MGASSFLSRLLLRRSVGRLRRATLRLAAEVPGVRAMPWEARDPEGVARVLERAVDELARERRGAAEDREVRDLILSSMEEGVLLADADGLVRFTNRAAERMLGGPVASVSALAPLALREAVRRALRDRRAEEAEAVLGTPARHLRATAVPVEGGGALLVLRDVTEAKRVEAMRRDFVANASHELKTPVASILAAAETIRTAAAEDPAAVAGFAERLERDASRLARIVADLLDLSRLEAGSERTERVSMDAVVRDEAERFAAQAREAGIELIVDVRPGPPVAGSRRDLGLLVRNLVDNAVRYTGPGGRVEVTVGPVDGGVALRVSDTGAGIPSRDLPRIFERFYRVDPARSRATGGTGLGLSIVKHVVENHGGEIRVESELGRGTAFEVRLPAAPAGEGHGAGPR
ncbi:MAG TPA: ATP-binding protein [Actinomycetota bacterium]|nr:ATP-binding protein [Actinomycetota bacterium]